MMKDGSKKKPILASHLIRYGLEKPPKSCKKLFTAWRIIKEEAESDSTRSDHPE